MVFRECIEQRDSILMEGALGERLKREFGIRFDENVAMAKLVYTVDGKMALSYLWNQYIAIAARYHLPFFSYHTNKACQSGTDFYG